MKKWRKLLVGILSLTMVVGCMPANSMSVIAMEDVISVKDIDIDFAQKQIESIEQYKNMLSSFNSRNHIRTTQEQVYDDNYGGAYIDEKGELVVLLVENSAEEIGVIQADTGNTSIKTVSCEYSYNDLVLVINQINDNLDFFSNNGISITEMYEDVYANRVKIGVLDLDKEKENIIRQVIDLPCMEFFRANELCCTTTAIDVEGGDEIQGYDGQASTLGFGATRNGIEGFVIAGHHGDDIGELIKRGDTVIGYVTATAFADQSTADAAFITKTADVNSTYEIDAYACHYLATSISDMPIGTVVYAYGSQTGLTSGKVVSNLALVSYDLNNDDITDVQLKLQSLAEYTVVSGDSGAPVFTVHDVYNGKITCKLLGITSGRNAAGNAVFSKYYNIALELNVTANTY